MFTLPKTTTVREIQRNYKKIFEQVKKTKEPIVVIKNNKPDVAIIDVKELEKLQTLASWRPQVDWDKLWRDIKRVRSFRGKGRGNLSQFIAEDRLRH